MKSTAKNALDQGGCYCLVSALQSTFYQVSADDTRCQTEWLLERGHAQSRIHRTHYNECP